MGQVLTMSVDAAVAMSVDLDVFSTQAKEIIPRRNQDFRQDGMVLLLPLIHRYARLLRLTQVHAWMHMDYSVLFAETESRLYRKVIEIFKPGIVVSIDVFSAFFY